MHLLILNYTPVEVTWAPQGTQPAFCFRAAVRSRAEGLAKLFCGGVARGAALARSQRNHLVHVMTGLVNGEIAPGPIFAVLEGCDLAGSDAGFFVIIGTEGADRVVGNDGMRIVPMSDKGLFAVQVEQEPGAGRKMAAGAGKCHRQAR
jgi:hypothetical protein